ncbi:hypothetical protein SAY87_026441 [Trapa incisa]|uniref:NHL repeat-containing protein 2 n=1 Tax=Trapa incisa TaxID=236973 RepID=A0AAN7H3W1_9MYRT|nr:hypothetical protein SAY87_026441 [Trapa incisa]
MAFWFPRLREISRSLPRVLSGHCHQWSEFYVWAPSLILPPHTKDIIEYDKNISRSRFHDHRYSTASQILDHSMHEVDLVSFMKSSLEELEGPNYYWLNKVEGDRMFPKRDMTSLVLVGLLFGNSSSAGCDSIVIQKLKSIQQRIPELYAIGLYLGNVAGSPIDQTDLVELIRDDYITFPILVANKKFFGIPKGPCYILLQDSMSPLFYHEEDLDLETIDKAAKELKEQINENSKLFDTAGWIVKQNVMKEPYLCSIMQNMLLSSPGCISSDETGDRLFISDSNHHRILITDANGKILDCIGSFPGFEDGSFESARFFHPGSTLYHDLEDCLYVVDSENHAIRRADLSKRIIETVYPENSSNKKLPTFWAWIKNKLGLQEEVVMDPESSDAQMLTFPWHMIQTHDNEFYILNQRFEKLWILDSSLWKIKETITGFQDVSEVCERLIAEKMSLLKELPHDWLHQHNQADSSFKDACQLSLLSSVISSENYIVACDPGFQDYVGSPRQFQI